MTRKRPSPPALATLSRIYRLLLRAYPRGVRDELAAELLAFFRRRYGDAWQQRGALGAVSAAVRGLLDVVGSGLLERVAPAGRRPGDQGVRISEGTAEMVADLWRDVRLALRGLKKAPVFTLVAVLTLGVGIGANTAVFSVLRALVLAPLPYPHSDRLVVIGRAMVKRDIPFYLANPADLIDYRGAKGFQQVEAVSGGTALLTEGDEPERITFGLATPGLFGMLGAKPVLGRTFTAEEGAPHDPNSRARYSSPVVLSHEFWTRRFGADPNVIGRALHFGFGTGGPTIVGVLPEGFRVVTSGRAGQKELTTDRPDIWGVMVVNSENPPRTGYDLYTLAKLKTDVTVEQANQQVDAISRRQREQFADYAARGMQAYVVPLQEAAGAIVRPMLFALLGAVGFVLLIACVNVANLLLVRAAGRAHEMSIRAALGGGRARIVRQLLAEAGVLALAGGIAGLALAWAALPFLKGMVPPDVPRLGAFGLDHVVLAFSLLATGLTATVFGLYPALRASRCDLMGVLRGRTTGGRPGARSRLVIMEVALSFVLVVGTGLVVRSFVALRHVDPGFRPDGVLTFTAVLPPRIRTAEERVQTKQRMRAHLAAIPDVISVGAGLAAPLDGNIMQGPYGNETTAGNENDFQQAWYRTALPGYFKTVGTSVLEGRTFTRAEENDSTNHIVVDQRVVQANWPGQSALGKRLYIKYQGNRAWYEVIGVVRDQSQASLTGETQGTIWFASRTAPWGPLSQDTWFVRVRGTPSSLGAAVRGAVHEVDDHIIVDDMHPLSDVVTQAEAPAALVLKIASLFGGVALLLAVIGLYGVIAHIVRERTGEFGLRMALGSGREAIFRIVLRQGMLVAAVGIGVGVAGALLLTHLMTPVLVGVAPDDPLTLVAVSGVFTVVAVVASLAPAIRAVRVDPMVALRSD